MSRANEHIDGLWHHAFALSGATGCAFPGEPSGDAARALLRLLRVQGVVRDDESERIVLDAVARCDACFDTCTATSRI